MSLGSPRDVSHGSGREPFEFTPAIAVGIAIALLVASLLLGVYNERASRIESGRQAEVEAQILARSVAGALAFDDLAATQEYVNALAANPAVEAAAAYDEDGRLVAGYRRVGPQPPPGARLQPPTFAKRKLIVTAPVTQGTTRFGSVYLRLTAETAPRRLARYLAVGAIILMSTLLVAVLGWSHASLREAHARLQAETREREKAEDALRQSQKMEAMGQLTGGVAHDFNNLLMAASSGLDLMARTSDPARRERLTEGIRHAIDRGASLTQQLLAFSRRAAVKPEVLDPGEALRSMLTLLDRSLREDVQVQLKLGGNLWPVEVDRSAFEVAVLNSAINARDAMPDGGVITLSAHNSPADAAHPHDTVQICIIDTGTGAAPEVATRVFEPFFTTKGVGQGTGLGLSQVYGFARSSGGDVDFLSRLGEGSTVCIRLPRSTRSLLEKAPDPAPAEARTRQARRVLLVEDDENVAALVQEMLQELGYEPTRASNAAAALQRLESEPNFDLVFSDMLMPGEMNGLELAEAIAAARPELPVVLTTGYSTAAAAASAKGIRLLAKPYRIETLATELEAVLATHDRRPPDAE